tara:strand:+ start:1094 stop:1282 length:189 start_codon:yes stop_codon:yes gene_type:complete
MKPPTTGKQKSPITFRPDPDVLAMVAAVREDGLIFSKLANKALREYLTQRGFAKRRVRKLSK